MDRHSCVLLNDIVVIAMQTINNVENDYQLDGQSVCLCTTILQAENGPDRTDCWWTGILSVENGPSLHIVDMTWNNIFLIHSLWHDQENGSGPIFSKEYRLRRISMVHMTQL